jgi:mannosyl-3-phosphoglycerate phosphatase
VIPPNYFPAPDDELETADGLFMKRFGASRAAILALLGELRAEGHDFEGFSDWTPERLAAVANLPVERAATALERCCSEPLLWGGDPASLHYLQERAAAAGMRLVQGGRFLHLMGRFDKAEALDWLRRRYEADGIRRRVIALGDSPNDAAMLDAADVAVVIRSARSATIEPREPNRVIRTDEPGPKGWNSAILDLLAAEPDG